MLITRTETPTGGPDRTPRERIVPLLTGPREVEPEIYFDVSESEGWPWASDSSVNTYDVQVAALREIIIPFEQLDSQAAAEQSDGDDDKGGVYTYPFSNIFCPIGEGDDDGDLNSSNFDEKMQAFVAKYFKDGKPQGGTEIMAAIRAGDAHYMSEFGSTHRAERPVRARILLSDGALADAQAFQAYLAQATLKNGLGSHGEWDEVWAVGILGDGTGKEAYSQYVEIAKTHSWIHAYYFDRVSNYREVAEDMALAVVPTQA